MGGIGKGIVRTSMGGLSLFITLLVLTACQGNQETKVDAQAYVQADESYGKGALLLTRFSSLEELKKVVRITYHDAYGTLKKAGEKGVKSVRLSHASGGSSVKGELAVGVDQVDFVRAQDSGFWAKVNLIFESPYAVWKRNDMKRVFALSRRRGAVFGEGDVAFYDLAQQMMLNISAKDKHNMSAKDLADKGFINTFNHVTSQAFMTTLFSEKLADLVADAHERTNMPELITGAFTSKQLKDMKNGPADNYLDIINNEWGQELGKTLKKKYNIKRKTQWSRVLLTNYLNDIQSYYTWAFNITFKPFREEDELIARFSSKLNVVMDDAPTVRER
ncbi:MAG: hypothetical protein AAFY71_26380 [Bacteroidota bacterium]